MSIIKVSFESNLIQINMVLVTAGSARQAVR